MFTPRLLFTIVIVTLIITTGVLIYAKLNNDAVSECIRAGREPLECRASIKGLP